MAAHLTRVRSSCQILRSVFALSQEDFAERICPGRPVVRGARQRDQGVGLSATSGVHHLGNQEQARAAQLRAAELTSNTAEQALLRRRIALLQTQA